ncbi:MAG: hypothetical protein IKM20_07855 [Erysipelotrichales bacterium]|nr:hypothetical protein [Erysipelotrichales bacterium]
MKKLLLFILAIICVLGIIFVVVTPISPEDSLEYQFRLVKSEYFDDVCEKLEVDVISEVKNMFAENGIILTDEEADRVISTLLDFEYTIHESKVYDDYANVSVTIETVDLFNIGKEKVKANISDIILGALSGKEVSNEAIVKEVIAELDGAPKDYSNTVNVRMNDIKGILYLLDFENNADLYNALSGDLLYELEMLE